MKQRDLGTKESLALYRIERAEENMKSAQLLLNAGDYKGANNRGYYAIFHAVTAVLALEGIGFKRHKDAIGYFNKNYIHTGIFPQELGHPIAQAELIRNKSDYDDFYMASKAETEGIIRTAKNLIELAKQFIIDHSE